MTTTSRKLDAINEVLSAVGFGTVTALGQTKHSTLAETVLDQEIRSFQGRGWYFNREHNVCPPVSAAGWLHVDPRALSSDPRRHLDTVVREGRLYDRRNRTYVWDTSPSNIVQSPFDLADTGAWTAQNSAAVTSNIIRTPYGEPGLDGLEPHARSADRLNDPNNSAVARLDQLLSGLVDGKEYVVSAYLRNGASIGSVGPQVTINQVSAGDTFVMSLDLTEEPPYFNNNTIAAEGLTARGWDPQMTLIETTKDSLDGGAFGSAVRASWVFARARWVYQSSGGAATLQLTTDKDLNAAANTDAFIWGVGIFEADSGPVSLDQVLCLEYHELPSSAREYVRTRAARALNDRTLRSRAIREALTKEEEMAWSNLLREEDRFAETNELDSNRSTLNVVHRRHYPYMSPYHSAGSPDAYDFGRGW